LQNRPFKILVADFDSPLIHIFLFSPVSEPHGTAWNHCNDWNPCTSSFNRSNSSKPFQP
jgi:hypothetical protein